VKKARELASLNQPRHRLFPALMLPMDEIENFRLTNEQSSIYFSAICFAFSRNPSDVEAVLGKMQSAGSGPAG